MYLGYMVFNLLKQYNKAISSYEKARNLDPNNKVNKIGYGKLLLKLNKHNKGLSSIVEGQGVIKFMETDFKII